MAGDRQRTVITRRPVAADRRRSAALHRVPGAAGSQPTAMGGASMYRALCPRCAESTLFWTLSPRCPRGLQYLPCSHPQGLLRLFKNLDNE